MAVVRYSAFKAAQKVLGWTGSNRGRKLVKVMTHRERELGRQIIIREKHGRVTCCYFTEPMIRRYLPEFFMRSEEDLSVEVKLHLDKVKAQLDASLDEKVASLVADLRADHRRLAKRVELLERNRRA